MDSKFRQGIFRPRNPEKYVGNPNNIIYRSSWELAFMTWCDNEDSIKQWASEEFSIKYVKPTDGRVHRYYPDGFIVVEDKAGTVKKYIIEIKPKKQTVPPKKRSRVTKSYIQECTNYAINEAKWKAAHEFALDNGVEFKILTEENIFSDKHYLNRKKK